MSFVLELLQVYVEAPLATIVAVLPEHIVVLDTFNTIGGFTETLTIAVSEHPELFPITV